MSTSSEVSIETVFCFFEKTYKTILFFTFLGLFFSAYYFHITPDQYEVISVIKINQIPTLEYQAVNIDNIDSLIALLRMPSTYSQKTIDECGFKGLYARENFGKSIKASLLSGTLSMLEVKFKVVSRNAGTSCMSAIYDVIKKEETRSFQSRAKAVDIELIKLKRLIKNKHESVDIIELSKTIKSYEDFLKSNEVAQTKIMSIYVGEHAVTSNLYKVLTIGSFIGMLLGLWYSIVFKSIQNFYVKKRFK